VRQGKGFPIGIAWSGLLGGVLVEGDNLHETLLLNFVRPGAGVDAQGRRDLPPWEDREPDTAAVRHALAPAGPVRLFTWQSRRIRLVAEGDRVIGCVLANGDALSPQDRQNFEPMSCWRRREPSTKKAGVPIYMPHKHLPGRAFWRGIGGLLAEKEDGRTLPPGILGSATLRIDEIGARRRVRLRAVGVVYGTNDSVVDEIIDDRLTVALALLRRDRPALASIAEGAVTVADLGVRALRNLAEDLSRAAGGDGDGARVRADAAAYAQLDGLYREWLATLDDDTDPEAAIAAWRKDAHRLLRRLGADLVRDASPAAWTGREVQGRLLNTPRAEGMFLAALHKTFVIPNVSEDERHEPQQTKVSIA